MGVIPRVGSSPTSGTRPRRADQMFTSAEHPIAPAAPPFAGRRSTVGRPSDRVLGKWIVKIQNLRSPTPFSLATPAARPTVEAMSRILVAEDDADVADAVRLSLEDAGHCCAIARDGAAALEMARTETPDLLVLDLAMPKVRS